MLGSAPADAADGTSPGVVPPGGAGKTRNGRSLDAAPAPVDTCGVLTGTGATGAAPARAAVAGSVLASTRTPRRPETPVERHARRKAWGAHYGPLMRRIIAPQIAAMDAQTRGR